MSPASFSFPNTGVGSTVVSPQFAVTNPASSGTTWKIVSIASSGADRFAFSIPAGQQLCSSIAPGASCTFEVAFTPGSSGSLSASIAITGQAGSFSPSVTSVTVSGTGIPSLTVSPSALSFNGTFPGSTSAAQAVALTNPVNGPSIQITSITLGGQSPSSFSIPTGSLTCTTLQPGSSCSFNAVFMPTLIGNFSASIQVNYTASGTTFAYSIPISGVGLPNISVSPVTFTFRNTDVGVTSAYQVFTITNSTNATNASVQISPIYLYGANVSSFSIPENHQTCTTVAAQSSCTFDVAFTPTTTGSLSASVIIGYSANGVLSGTTVSVTGIGMPIPVSITPTVFTFNKTLIGSTSAYAPFTLTNTSTTAFLTVTAIAPSGANASSFFIPSARQSCHGVAPGASCNFDVAFAPTIAGNLNTTVVISDNASGSPQQTVTVSGYGQSTAPNLSVSPASVMFSNTYAGLTAAYKAVTVTNTGLTRAVISSIVPSGANASSFSIPSNHQTCSTLGYGESCTFDVAFTPTTTGSLISPILVSYGSPGSSPQSVASVSVTGTGLAPLKISPASYVFRITPVGQASYVLFTLTNSENTTPSEPALTISNIVVSGPNASSFSIPTGLQTCGTLGYRASCTFGVAFTPTTADSFSASIVVTASAGGEAPTTTVLPVSGTGVAAP